MYQHYKVIQHHNDASIDNIDKKNNDINHNNNTNLNSKKILVVIIIKLMKILMIMDYNIYLIIIKIVMKIIIMIITIFILNDEMNVNIKELFKQMKITFGSSGWAYYNSTWLRPTVRPIIVGSSYKNVSPLKRFLL